MITVTVLRPAGRDRHGDPLPGGGDHTVDGMAPAPPAGTEDTTTEGETVTVDLVLYGPFDADVIATDQIRIDDPAWAGTYDVVGEPRRWQNPFDSHEAGCELRLTRTGKEPTDG